jgi:hypothetical protein
LVITLASPVVYAPYLPFGLVAWSLVPLSTYLFGLGFYLSAYSVSLNSKLRNSIRDSVIEESKFLGPIGIAKMEQDIQNKVKMMMSKQSEKMKEDTGVEGVEHSLTDDEITQYIKDVLREIHK